MTDKPTLEEIKAKRETVTLTHFPLFCEAHFDRLLEICREQAGVIRAADERLEKAAVRVWGEHVMGCDTAERMADWIEHLRGELAAADSTNRLEG